MSLAQELPVERLVELRRRGWTWIMIARSMDVSVQRVQRYACTVLPARYLGRISRQDVVGWLLGDGWDPTDRVGLGHQAKCSQAVVMRALRMWRLKGKWGQVEEERCRRCRFFGEPGNPVSDGLCQWCQWELAGWDLAELYRTGQAAEALAGMQLRRKRIVPSHSDRDANTVRETRIRKTKDIQRILILTAAEEEEV